MRVSWCLSVETDVRLANELVYRYKCIDINRGSMSCVAVATPNCNLLGDLSSPPCILISKIVHNGF